MDTEHGQSAPYDPAQQPTPPPPPPPPPPPGGWAAPGSGANTGWPGGYGPGQGYAPRHGYAAGWQPYPPPEAGRPGLRKQHRKMALVAATAAVGLIAGGTAWATVGTGSASLSASTIASRTDPGLVDVISTIGYEGGTAEGTGMVLTSNGTVLTNNHVIAGATSVKVRDIGNGRTYTAKVVGYSDANDVAVLHLEGASGLSTVSLGSSASIASGQTVVALGNAEGKDGVPAVATGTITGLDSTVAAEDEGDGAVEHLSDMIRTNAPIEPGDSGGPLLNSSGQVIGMDTAASTDSQYGTTAEVATTAFAIPISRALTIADQIEAGTSSSTVHIGATAFLGVAVNSQAQTSGVEIEGVINGTAAAGAGLAEGDVITSVGGHEVTSDTGLQAVMAGYHPGDRVAISWTDGYGQTHTATITLTAGPAA